MIVAFNFGVNLIYAISLYAGLLMYASYHNCDLVSVKAIKSADQILPYFVMNVANTIPGLPGLFMAGVFSAALSSMSTGLNSMAGVLYEDFIEPFLKVKISEERASLMMKIISVVFGVICVGMVFIVENLGAVVQGTLIGGITGMIVMGFICFGTQASIASGQIKFEKKPFTTDGCSSILQMDNFTLNEVLNSSINILPTLTESASDEPPFRIFHLSYTLYTLFGLIISTSVGLIASAVTGFTDLSDLDVILLSPVMRPLFAGRCKGGNQKVRRKMPESVEVIKEKDEALNLLSNNQS
ncbi:hypothetical protein J437_LFUL009586 [Ladona fulva]|uniref:Sodium-coupled monocarboxylate transporter 1 n=1 Tax=Ladona fulva TaxID=123851 RepID=A0A8K0P126_LADFU|nr:hypothetical protein J437_LFUL009586 [Ladona fulva]